MLLGPYFFQTASEWINWLVSKFILGPFKTIERDMTSIQINGRKCDLGRNSLNQSPGSNGAIATAWGAAWYGGGVLAVVGIDVVNLMSCQWPGEVTLRHAATASRRHTRWEY